MMKSAFKRVVGALAAVAASVMVLPATAFAQVTDLVSLAQHGNTEMNGAASLSYHGVLLAGLFFSIAGVIGAIQAVRTQQQKTTITIAVVTAIGGAILLSFYVYVNFVTQSTLGVNGTSSLNSLGLQ